MDNKANYLNQIHGGHVDKLNNRRLDASGAITVIDDNPKIKIVDLSNSVNPKAVMNYGSGSNGLPMQVQPLSQDNVKGRFSLGGRCKQVGYYNPTTTIIKLSLTKSFVDSTSYEYIINANKVGLLPPLNFTDVNYLQEAIVAGVVLPLLFFYECIVGNPNNNSIT